MLCVTGILLYKCVYDRSYTSFRSALRFNIASANANTSLFNSKKTNRLVAYDNNLATAQLIKYSAQYLAFCRIYIQTGSVTKCDKIYIQSIVCIQRHPKEYTERNCKIAKLHTHNDRKLSLSLSTHADKMLHVRTNKKCNMYDN